MKKLIKNVFLVLLVMFSLSMFSENVSATSKTGKLAIGSSSFQRTFTFSDIGNGVSGALTGKKSHFYHMYINSDSGESLLALCFGLQQSARSGDTYTDTGKSVDTYGSSNYIRQAYQYYLNHKDDKEVFIVAQIAVWMVQFDAPPTSHSDEYLAYVTQAYKKFGYDLTDESTLERIRNQIAAILSSAPYTGDLTVWVSDRISGQPMIAPGTAPKTYTCDDGTKQVEVMNCISQYLTDNPTATEEDAVNYCKANVCVEQVKACPGGKMKISGDVPDCEDDNSTTTATFRYTANVGTDENIHRIYGEVENVAGLSKYCKIYCTESAEATLPGGFANALTSGTKIVWPTSANTKNTLQGNVYPLKFSGTKTCHIAIEDPNSPGDGCNYTPLEDYTKVYTVVNSLHNAKDLDGTTYENVRVKSGDLYVGTQNKSSQVVDTYCGDLGNTVNLGVATYYTAKSTGYYNIYSNGANGLRSDLKSKAESYQNCHNSDSCHYKKCCIKTEKRCHTDNGGYGRTHCSNVCVEEGHASKCGTSSDYDNRKSDYEKAKENYEKTVTNSINNCKTYITNFNASRNIQNEISKCFNYETKGCTGGSSSCSIYDFTAGATLNFNDTEYSYSNSTKQVNSVKYNCKNCTVSNKMKNLDSIKTFSDLNTNPKMESDINSLKNRTIVVSTNDISFEMSSPYRYVNKRTGKATTSASEYTVDVGYNFLPLSYDNKTGTKYKIGLSNIYLGDTSGGTARFNDISDYVCHYEVKGTGSNDDECVCPAGTMHEGIDLFNTIKNEPNGMTCTDAQLKYCDDSSMTDEDFPQDDKEDKYCPNDMSKKITACLNNGYTYNYCLDLICYGGNSSNNGGKLDGTYRCKNTNGVSGAMDITSCVYTKVLQGLTVNQAIDECDALICPISGGIKIIYRTISLENPFPGKNIAKQVSGFNQDVKGRYPGSNWNSLTLVQNEILNNRKVSGSQVYKKEPLYTFVLNSDTIKAIRKYNDTRKAAGGYADFTLDCKNNNSTACVSSFVHDRTYGLTGGTCENATSKNNFYICNEQ